MGFKSLFRNKFPKKGRTDFPGGYIPGQYILDGARGLAGRALVIGDQYGRDYELLKPHFTEVKAIDVVDNKAIPAEDLILHDASKRTQLEDGSFDFVVACNVIEHMFGDYDCICEMNRLLRPGGRFFIDVPFLADRPYFHFRVFTPKIFRRMMEQAGFKTIDERYRGLAFSFSNNAVAGIALLLHPLFGVGALLRVNRGILALQRLIDRSYALNRMNPEHFGGFLLYEKVGAPAPEVEIQIRHFSVVAQNDPPAPVPAK